MHGPEPRTTELGAVFGLHKNLPHGVAYLHERLDGLFRALDEVCVEPTQKSVAVKAPMEDATYSMKSLGKTTTMVLPPYAK